MKKCCLILVLLLVCSFVSPLAVYAKKCYETRITSGKMNKGMIADVLATAAGFSGAALIAQTGSKYYAKMCNDPATIQYTEKIYQFNPYSQKGFAHKSQAIDYIYDHNGFFKVLKENGQIKLYHSSGTGF